MFRLKNTNVSYTPSLFNLGVVEEKGPNLRSSQNILVRMNKNGKIIKLSVFVEDIIPLFLNPNDLNISGNELLALDI